MREIYDEAYKNDNWRSQLIKLIWFNSLSANILRYKLKCIKEKPVERTVECPDECLADIPRNMYVRKDGKLMKKNPDGSEVEMGDVSSENCYTTMFEGDDATCEDSLQMH